MNEEKGVVYVSRGQRLKTRPSTLRRQRALVEAIVRAVIAKIRRAFIERVEVFKIGFNF